MIYLFLLSLFFIFYAYAGYPLLIWGFTFFRSEKNCGCSPHRDSARSKVTLIISAYNEGASIENKILNSLAIEYPRELLEIMVVSDASDDNTDQIVRNYSYRGISLQRYEGRLGKSECLNRAVPAAKGDIVIFSDANSLYESDAVMKLIRNFADPEIGFVTGSTRYISSRALGTIVEPISIYSRLEQLTKDLESRISSCVGADGAIFAIRKNLYKSLKRYDINDLVTPFTIIEQGYRGVFEKSAFCLEDTAKNIEGEFHRQVRITNRTIRAIASHSILLNPFRFGFFSFFLFSHKVCKLCVPFFLMTLIASNIIIAPKGGIFAIMLTLQLIFYAMAALYSTINAVSGLFSFGLIPKTFVVANCAIIVGWFRYFRGETFTTWTTGR
jgi:cellulose synthase/poly-beta-1,6-N-acetylglucosamine synthase-like glycosyltransferase